MTNSERFSEVQKRAILLNREEEDKRVAAVLSKLGLKISSVFDLVRLTSLPTVVFEELLKLLPAISDSVVKEGIVRALAIKTTSGGAEEVLLKEFGSISTYAVGGQSLKWAIGNTLGLLASDKYANQLIALATDRSHGAARQMVVVGLARLKDSRVSNVLMELLDDPTVCGHAVIALGKLREKRAGPLLMSLQNHSQKWVRTEVKKALKRIS